MKRVTGLGGVFFKAKDPRRLRDWYRKRLGIDVVSQDTFGPDSFGFEWRERDDPARAGFTIWGPFPEHTRYFDPSTAPFMLNYRVADLDALMAQLREEGVAWDGHIEEYPYGRFAWISDPEGNRIELWEPAPGH